MKKILKSKKGLKNSAGITLVALIITVILMLILAGVAISAVIDGDGLFKKSREATQQYENAAQDENKTISNLMNYIDKYLVGGISSYLPTIEVSNVNSTTFKLKISSSNLDNDISKYEIYINGKLEEIIETTDKTATYNVTGKSAETTYVCKVIVYDKDGNSSESKEITQNLAYQPTPLGTTVFNENKTYYGDMTGTYDNPIIPKGFYPINENNAIWGTVDGYKYGLVIQDGDLNQFVWVPVSKGADGTNINFDRDSEFDGYVTMESCVETEATSPGLDTIISNVNVHEGFYIARYEAGTKENGKVVSKQGVNPIRGVDWSTAKTEAETMYPISDQEHNVISKLIYGANWDTALNFIVAYGGNVEILTNSSGYGNYSTGDNITDSPAICGATASDTNLEKDEFRQKNIYDMAGNLWEWTMETYNSVGVNRGGNYTFTGIQYPITTRCLHISGGLEPIGLRVILYIEE